MSALTMTSGGAAVRRPHPRRLAAVPEAPLAEVRDIATAPSAARRRAAVLGEDPAAQRRPLRAASEAAGSARAVSARAVSARRPALLRLVGGVAAVVVATGIAAGAGIAARPDPYSGPTFTHSVAAGESVWGLAQSLGSDRPLDQVVSDIERLNDLGGGLVPGQEVTLPAE